MRNFVVPHSTQMDRVAGRPFFMVTASMSREAVLTLHLTQYISTGSEGVAVIGDSWGRMAVAIVTCRGTSSDPGPVARILVTLAPYVSKGRIHRMFSPLRAVRRTNCPRPQWTYQAGCAARCLPHVCRCWPAGSAKAACWNPRAVIDHANVADSSWRSTS